MKDFKIIELMELFDEGEVTTADQIDRPERALEREAIDDFMKRNPQADGGRTGFYEAGLVERGPNTGKYSVKFPTNTALEDKYKGTKYGTKTEIENLIKERAEVAKESYKAGVSKSAAQNKKRLFDDIKSVIAKAKQTKNYGLLKVDRRDTGGKLSSQAAKFLNQADPSSKFYKGKDFAKKFAKDLGISTKELNFLLNERAASIRETGRIATQKAGFKRVDPLKIKMVNLIDQGVDDVSKLAKELKVTRAKVIQLGGKIYKDVYATSSAIGKGASRKTGMGVATFLPDTADEINAFLKKMHNVKGLETVEQTNIKNLLIEAFGDGKNPELYKLYNKKINEYYDIKRKLGTNINLDLDHPLSSEMIKNLKLGKEAKLFVQPLTMEINRGVKSLLDKTYAQAFASKSPDRTAKMKKIINLSKKLELPIGTTGIISEPFYKQNIPKKIIEAAETQNRVLRNIKNISRDEIREVFPDYRSKLVSSKVKEIDINNLRNLMVELGCGKRGTFSEGTTCEIKGRKKLETIIKSGVKPDSKDAVLATQILRAGRSLGSAFTLSALFGPAAIAFTAAAEAGIVGYDMLTTGKTFKETIGDSLFNYALGKKTKIDPDKELFKRFGRKDNQGNFLIKGMTDDKLLNIAKVFDQSNQLNSILKQQMKITDLDKLVTAERAQTKNQFVGPDDEMLQTDEAIRREQELKNARQELENLLTDYRTPLPVDTGDFGGLSKEDAILADMASGAFEQSQKDLADATKAAEIQKLESSGPVFMGKVFPKFEEGRQADLLNLKSSINPASKFAIESYENPDLTSFTPMRPFGLAGGGIAKLAGIDEGPQTESLNPDSQGLSGLLKRAKKA
jgi:hypothetical protein